MNIPSPVTYILERLHVHKYEGYIVGGCVRDLLRGAEPYDWDVTTNATPEEIQEVFPDTLYNNRFGTVIVRHEDMEVEVTPYRKEGHYSDHRRPDAVEFGKSLREDLERRDFTINAMAMDLEGTITDPHNGQKDLQAKTIRCVGVAQERFSEDALRMLRALRFAAQLSFSIEERTLAALKKHKSDIQHVSKERVRDELMKLLGSDDALRGLLLLDEARMIDEIIPELAEGRGVSQNLHHVYSVLYHNMLSAQYCPSSDALLRLAALLHDVGKPRSKEGEGKTATFHDHDRMGADMTIDIMKRLRFSNDEIARVEHLVRYHMFYYSLGEVSDKGVRRMIKRLGKENIEDFFVIRIADRMGSGCQVELPYKLKELWRHMEEVQKDPIDTRMLEINGTEIMELLGIEPGPEIGRIMNALLEEILDDPSRNTREYLTERAQEIYRKE